MTGYSWYPVDVDDGVSITVQGTFIFANDKFEGSEARKGGTYAYTCTSLYDSAKNTTTQHYMLHEGIFHDVVETVKVGSDGLTFQGTIGKVNDTLGTGALICGTVGGTGSKNLATVKVNGTISLNGIKVYNLNSANGEEYAPLLINRAAAYSTMNIANVSTAADAYTTVVDETTTTVQAATSLIGNVGSSTADNVNITFSGIKLDARSGVNVPAIASTVYHTTRSIFTKATLLNQYAHDQGSAGVYNYTYEEDWEDDAHNVTYGLELWDGSVDGSGTPDNHTSARTQYIGLEHCYSGSNYYTDPMNAAQTTGPYNFNAFLPYVYEKYDPEANLFQLEVNHGAAEEMTGCGTYNDPYVISDGDQLETIAKILRGGYTDGFSINIPTAGIATDWCDDKKAHAAYAHSSALDTNCYYKVNDEGEYISTVSMSVVDVRTHLAGAYYKLSGTITIDDSNFTGLGALNNASDTYAVFRGVIDGAGYEIINQTQYPLVASSYGSVVRNMNISVEAGAISISQTGTTAFGVGEGCKNYGAVIGQVLGGDNIVEKVDVSFTDTSVSLGGGYAQLIPVGGYVGVVVNGGLIFRDMKRSDGVNQITYDEGIFDGVTFSASANSATDTDPLNDTNYEWLYVNPIIGRVINGYAVTEATAYRPYENGTRSYGVDGTDTDANGHVTMQNGTKNYSIADINKNSSNLLDVTGAGASTINVPDDQSLFLLSLIVNSGMGIQETTGSTADSSSIGTLGYYNGYCTARHSGYSTIGNAASSDDYTKARADGYAITTSYVPYLIWKYTKSYEVESSDVYYAKLISYTNNSYALSLTDRDDQYILPDGFRGIGNFFYDSANLRLKLTGLEGNGDHDKTAATIIQNTSYRFYQTGFDNYLPNTGGERAGLGLFNCQTRAGTYSDMILSGNVKSDVINRSDKNGAHLQYTTGNVDQAYVLAVGTLFGTVSGIGNNNVITMNDVAVDNISLESAKHAGGLIGYLPDGNHQNVTIRNNADCTKVKIHTGVNAGGLVGKYQDGFLNVDFNGKSFRIKEIVGETTSTKVKDTDENYFKYGVGGLVGTMRSNQQNTTYNTYNIIKNITIENTTEGEAALVNAAGGTGEFNVGGMFGILNRAPVKVSNCHIKNISCVTNGYAGGLVGWNTTYCPMLVNNTYIEGDKDTEPVINGGYKKTTAGTAGGFIGYTGGTLTVDFTIQNCSVKGYTISGYDYAGGVIGGRESTQNKIMYLENFELSDCTIKGHSYAGGIVGLLKSYKFCGYNILTKDIAFQDLAGGTIGKLGGIIGENRNQDIKLAGFSRQGTIGANELVGYYTGSKPLGDEGYVVFADYNGACLNEDTYSKIFSGINDEDNVSISTKKVVVETVVKNDGVEVSSNSETTVTYGESGLTPGEDVTERSSTDGDYTTTVTTTTTVTYDNVPYVTSSNPVRIDNTNFLTGDAMGYDDTISYGKSVISDIIEDVYDVGTSTARETAARRYSTAYTAVGGAATESLVELLDEGGKYSSYQVELGDSAKVDKNIDFPVLVVDDTNVTNTTRFINNYLRYLTNTKYDFARQSLTDGGEKGTASDIFRVQLGNCIWNSGDGKFIYSSSCTTLQNYAGLTFKLTGTNFDNGGTTGQFTLIDVQFFDPGNTDEVAYHLYVPVVVKKILRYDFNASFITGTTYRTAPYTAVRGNTLIENVGNPVTLEARWIYKLTLEDWNNFTQSGENLLRTFPKKIQVADGAGNGFPDFDPEAEDGRGTRLVLVDPNNHNKYYYGDTIGTSGLYTTGTNNYLNLNAFTDAGGREFASINFNDFFIVTAASGTGFSRVTLEEGKAETLDNYVAAGATVRASDGYYYMPDEEGIYSITLAYKEGVYDRTTDYITEDYYISFFTDADDTRFYHLEFYAPSSFQVNDFPTKLSMCDHPHLLLGDFFDMDFDIEEVDNDEVTNPQEISLLLSNFNDHIEARLTAGIAIKEAARRMNLDVYLTGTSVDIYQSFLIMLNRQDSLSVHKKGILTTPTVDVKEYTINGSNVLGSMEPVDGLINANYIELRNNVNLRQKLLLAYTTRTEVKIAATVRLTYTDEGSILDQFPKRAGESDVIGTLIGGSSNLSSSKTNAANSRTSSEAWGTKLYYCTIDANANLTLNSDDVDNQDGEYTQLGINASDLSDGEALTGLVPIKTLAVYEVGDLTEASSAQSMKLTVKLSKKSNYAAPLTISDYITSLVLKQRDGSGLIKSNEESSTTEYVYIVTNPRDTLYYDSENQLYQIPLTFSAYTGSNDNFEGAGRFYSNYMISLEAELYYDTEAEEAIDGSADDDHVIYTNARLHSDIIEE